MNRFTNTMTPEQRAAERKAAITWGAFVIAILGSSLTLAIVMLIISGSDPSFAVEPDYYDQAINWDDHAAQRELNRQLGWTIDLTTAPIAADRQRSITARVFNKDGAPITDASVGVVAFHNARAANRFAFPMTPTDAGAFTAKQPLTRAGKWEFRFTVVSPDATFTTTLTENLPALTTTGGPR